MARSAVSGLMSNSPRVAVCRENLAVFAGMFAAKRYDEDVQFRPTAHGSNFFGFSWLKYREAVTTSCRRGIASLQVLVECAVCVEALVCKALYGSLVQKEFASLVHKQLFPIQARKPEWQQVKCRRSGSEPLKRIEHAGMGQSPSKPRSTENLEHAFGLASSTASPKIPWAHPLRLQLQRMPLRAKDRGHQRSCRRSSLEVQNPSRSL